MKRGDPSTIRNGGDTGGEGDPVDDRTPDDAGRSSHGEVSGDARKTNHGVIPDDVRYATHEGNPRTGGLPDAHRGPAHGLVSNILIVAFILAAYFLLLGYAPLQEPDEGRYAEIAREMIETGDWVTPRLDYVKYFEKPILHYWLTAIGIKLFGQNEFAVRFWPALLSLLTIVGVYVTGRRLFGARAGKYAALVLAATPIWIIAGRTNTIDPTVSSFTALSLMSFLLFDHSEGEWARRSWLGGFYVFAALATLAKGLIGGFFPFGIVLIHIFMTRRFRLLKELKPWYGALLYLGVTAPWFVLVIRRNPDFAWFFFIHEHVLRFVSDIHRRTKPFYFFIPVLIAATLPFVAYLFPVLVRSIKRMVKYCFRRAAPPRSSGPTMFLTHWFLVIFVFFSLSHSKLGLYILPVFPALALLMGRYMVQLERLPSLRKKAARAQGFGMAACAVLTLVLWCVAIWARDRIVIATWPYLVPVTLVGVCVYYLNFRIRKKNNRREGAWLLCLYSTLFTVGTFLCAQQVGAHERTARPLIETIRQMESAGDRIVHLSCYVQGQLFYLDQRPIVAAFVGELEFGMDRTPDREKWFWSLDTFYDEWCSEGRLWVITKEYKLENLFDLDWISKFSPGGPEGFYKVARCGAMVLLTNQPVEGIPFSRLPSR